MNLLFVFLLFAQPLNELVPSDNLVLQISGGNGSGRCLSHSLSSVFLNSQLNGQIFCMFPLFLSTTQPIIEECAKGNACKCGETGEDTVHQLAGAGIGMLVGCILIVAFHRVRQNV